MRPLTPALVLGVITMATHAHLSFAQRIQPPQPPKRLILNDDGHGGFYGGRLDTAEALRKHPQRFKNTHLWIYQWGVMCGTKVNYPSQTAELCGEGVSADIMAQVRQGDRTLLALLQKLRDEGVDTLQCVAQGCHEAGLLCYVTIRANPCYPLKASGWPDGSMARYFNAKFWWDHPEFRIVLKNGTTHTNLSYVYPDVRQTKLRIIGEVVQRDVDGIDIDFLRHPPLLGYEEPLRASFVAGYGVDPKTLPDNDGRWISHRCQVMTDFMREARRIVDEASRQKKRPLGISVRIDHRQYRAWGLDIEGWIKEGLIDILAVAQYGYGGYSFDLTPFAKLAQGTKCLVFASEEAITEGHDPTPKDEEDRRAGTLRPSKHRSLTVDEYCERARNWYAQGAAGIHTFNESRLQVFQVLGDPVSFPSTRNK